MQMRRAVAHWAGGVLGKSFFAWQEWAMYRAEQKSKLQVG